jgi:hypothetical protein
MSLIRFASSRFLVSGFAIVAGLAAAAPADAATCIQRYAECLVQASDLATWWQRSAAGIDCYLDAISCLKLAYG